MNKKINVEEEISLLCTFGCATFEQEIFGRIKYALENGRMPSFEDYNNPNLGNCSCRTYACHWTADSIEARLREKGIWDKMERLLAEACKPQDTTTIRRNPDGTILVDGKNLPYVGGYDSYREMNADACEKLAIYPAGYVCHLRTDSPKHYVVMFPNMTKEGCILID